MPVAITQRQYWMQWEAKEDQKIVALLLAAYKKAGHEPQREDWARRWRCRDCGFVVTNRMLANDTIFEMPPKCPDWLGG